MAGAVSDFGRVILLNGTSSAGKTTVARMIQQLRPEAIQHIALDQFRDGLPDRFRGLNSAEGTPGARGLNVVPVHASGAPGDPEMSGTAIHLGDVGLRMLTGMRQAIAAFAKAGNDVVVDDMRLDANYLGDYLMALTGIAVTFVAIHCDATTLNQRETERPGRFPGTAVLHMHSVHAGCIYDVEVNTSAMSPRECAESILAVERTPPKPCAFDRLAGLGSASEPVG